MFNNVVLVFCALVLFKPTFGHSQENAGLDRVVYGAGLVLTKLIVENGAYTHKEAEAAIKRFLDSARVEPKIKECLSQQLSPSALFDLVSIMSGVTGARDAVRSYEDGKRAIVYGDTAVANENGMKLFYNLKMLSESSDFEAAEAFVGQVSSLCAK